MVAESRGLRAGAWRADITPPAGVELMGYGAREGAATAVHDPLHARALALSRGSEGSERALLIVCAELCLMAPDQARALRERISRATGLSSAQILISCTHTHSGPDTGLAALAAGLPEPPHVAPLFDGIVTAASAAWQARRSARLGWGRAAVQIGRNRRLEGGPVDREVAILRVVEEGGQPIATLFSHGCHGTVLGHDNLEISADWSGVASRAIEAAGGGVAPFLLGAHADIDPRTRALMDLAIPGQSVGLGFEAVRVLGLEVAEAVLERMPEIETGPAALGAASRSLDLPLHPGDVSEAAARESLESRRRGLATLLGVAPEAIPRPSELHEWIQRRARDLPLAQAREAIARARLYFRDRTGPRLTGGKRRVGVEVQSLRIGEGALLALPVEPTTEVGLDWAARAQRLGQRGRVAGIGNGWLRYLPHPRDLAEPFAHHRYEVLMSLLAPPACEQILDLGERLLRDLLSLEDA
ncbi:MAG: neutral/alkaline non-lysosomal ceramidase N-terminal domain-containing protein [Myxococcota bacterium]